MMDNITFVVEGKPRGKGRPMIDSRKKGKRGYKKKEDIDYERKVRNAFLRTLGENGEGFFAKEGEAVSVMVMALFSVPESWSVKKKAEALKYGWHMSKPDGDNILKAITDPCNGIAWDDDSCVAKMVCQKMYINHEKIIEDGERVIVTFEKLNELE